MTLKDLYVGRTAKLAVQRNILCGTCDGIGGKAGSVTKCSTCDGRGIQIKLRQIGPGMMQQIQQHCSDCQGNGEVIKESDRCKACKGRKVVPDRKILEVHVDPGMRDEQKVVFAGESNQEKGKEPGDIVIVLDEKEHEFFQRRGMDLICRQVRAGPAATHSCSVCVACVSGVSLILLIPPAPPSHKTLLGNHAGRGAVRL